MLLRTAPAATVLRAAALVLAATTALAAQDEPAPLVGGPPPGQPVPACRAFAPSGPYAGREIDVAEKVGKAPAAILFVHQLDRNTGPMIGGLDQLGVQLAWTGLQVHAVRVAADRTDAEIAAKRSSDAMRLHRPLLVGVDGVEGPGAFALHRKATLTLVLCKDGLVVRSIAFTDTGRGDLGKLRALVEEVTGPVPTDPQQLREAVQQRLEGADPAALRAMVAELAVLAARIDRAEANTRAATMRRDADGRPAARGASGAQPAQDAPPAKPREGKPPDDDELRGLLRRAIQKSADDAELTAVFDAVAARVGTDAALRAQAVDMFKLMLSLDYGNDDAKRRARAFVTEHAGK
jgi:hypothetical protein